MYQVAVIANATRSLDEAVAKAKGFMDYGLVDCIEERDYVASTNAYFGCTFKTLAIYPVHCTKAEDCAYYAIVSEVTGCKWVDNDHAQVIFIGDEFSEYLNEDAIKRVINFYARLPSVKLNRGDREQLMASVLGPIFNIVPPSGLNETYTVNQIEEPGRILAYNVPDAPRSALVIKTAAHGNLPQVSDIYNLVDKVEPAKKK